MEPIVAIFTDDLTALAFMQDGKRIDPRGVLNALAAGLLTVEYEREVISVETMPSSLFTRSETWRLVPKGEIK